MAGDDEFSHDVTLQFILSLLEVLDVSELIAVSSCVHAELLARAMNRDKSAAQEPKPAH